MESLEITVDKNEETKETKKIEPKPYNIEVVGYNPETFEYYFAAV